MKWLILTLFILIAVSSSVYAQVEKTPPVENPKMMQCPMMDMMSKHSSMMQDIIGTIKDMLIIQQRLLKGLSTDEKQGILNEIENMLEKLDKMQRDKYGMMKGMEIPQKDMKETGKEENLNKKPEPQEEHKVH